jgi:hypothetical protein
VFIQHYCRRVDQQCVEIRLSLEALFVGIGVGHCGTDAERQKQDARNLRKKPSPIHHICFLDMSKVIRIIHARQCNGWSDFHRARWLSSGDSACGTLICRCRPFGGCTQTMFGAMGYQRDGPPRGLAECVSDIEVVGGDGLNRRHFKVNEALYLWANRPRGAVLLNPGSVDMVLR